MTEQLQDQCFKLLETRLADSKKQQTKITQALDLPPAPQALREQVKAASLAPNFERLVLFLFDHQGARSDFISSSIAIGNVSDTWTKPAHKKALEDLGLKINCKALPSVNRFGMATTIGHLWIRPATDNQYWQKRTAANDSE